jgi:hypothetical protein
MGNLFERRIARLMLIGVIMLVTGLVDFLYGPLIDARGFSVLGIVLIVVGLLLRTKE